MHTPSQISERLCGLAGVACHHKATWPTQFCAETLCHQKCDSRLALQQYEHTLCNCEYDPAQGGAKHAQ
eukprot:1640943-Amphidinium_carterae.1